MGKYKSQFTGPQIDAGIGAAMNPDTTPTASSSALITSGAVATAEAAKAPKTDLASISITGSTNNTGSTIPSGTYFYKDGALVRAKADIANGATLTSGTNYETVTAGGLNELKSATTPVIGKGINLLDNWYFLNPVNQRGQNSYIGLVYGIDRWKTVYAESGGSLTVGQSGISSSDTRILMEFLPDELTAALEGKSVTISALYGNDKLITETVTFPVSGETAQAQGDGVSIYCVSKAQNGSFSSFGLILYGATVQAVKLELGDTQTLARQFNGAWVLNDVPRYGNVLRECQRYFVKFMVAGDFFSDSYGIVSIPVYYPVRLNKNPTSVTIDNFQYYWSSWQTPTLNDVRSNSDDMCGLRLATTISTPAYTTCSGYVNIEADL